MKLFGHTGLVIALFWCAAMVVAPIAAAAGAGQDRSRGHGVYGTDPSEADSDNRQIQQGTWLRTGQADCQNGTGPIQGIRWMGLGRGNPTVSGNHTRVRPNNGSLTGRPDLPGRHAGNSTGFSRTARGIPWAGNMTGIGINGTHQPACLEDGNMTTDCAWPRYRDGNMTRPEQLPQGNSDTREQRGTRNHTQAHDQKGSGNTLSGGVTALLTAHGIV